MQNIIFLRPVHREEYEATSRFNEPETNPDSLDARARLRHRNLIECIVEQIFA